MKLATEYAGAKSAADNMSAFLSLAKSGNKAASVNVPLQGALEITTAQGVHRINRTEVEQYASAGSLFDRISGRIHGVLSGNKIPADVLNDMQQLQNVIAGTAETKYKNGLTAVNQNYGASFTPVQMATSGLPDGGGKVIDRATAQKFYEAAGRDPDKARDLAKANHWKVQ